MCASPLASLLFALLCALFSFFRFSCFVLLWIFFHFLFCLTFFYMYWCLYTSFLWFWILEGFWGLLWSKFRFERILFFLFGAWRWWFERFFGCMKMVIRRILHDDFLKWWKEKGRNSLIQNNHFFNFFYFYFY